MKKSVFERIKEHEGTRLSSSIITNKSTHGFCNIFIQTGECPLGDTCKFIHEQPNLDKQSNSKDDLRITKTITRVVDMSSSSSSSIKSTVTVTNEQRPTSSSNSILTNRTVVEGGSVSNDQSDRRTNSSDRKKTQNHHSDSKSKSSNKKSRSKDSNSPFSSTSDYEYSRSSRKHRKKSDKHSTSSRYKKHNSISPNRKDKTVSDLSIRQIQSNNRSPKRTIVITERNKNDSMKRTRKDTKSNSDIEFLGTKQINREKRSIETIHQQTENDRKLIETKREKKSPNKTLFEIQRRRSSSTNTNTININDKDIQIKTEDTKNSSIQLQNSIEQCDRSILQTTSPTVQLSPKLPITTTVEKSSDIVTTETERVINTQPTSPVYVVLDDDSSPAPSIDKNVVRKVSTISSKKTKENDKYNPKPSKRSRTSDKSHRKEKTNEDNEPKRKRLNDGSSRKLPSDSKSGRDHRSKSRRSNSHRNENASSKDDLFSRKYKDKSETKKRRNSNSKDRNFMESLSSKSRNNNKDRRNIKRSSFDKRSSTNHRDKEKENVTDLEEHLDEPILPKQTALEAYISMDWSMLSRDKRIPLNTQITSRITRDNNSNDLLTVSERLLTSEQKEKLNGIEFHPLPLTYFMKQLQTKPTSTIIHSCNQRFGSCAKDMIDMRHKWLTRSIEPVQEYEFINKEHYLAFQQAINSLSNNTSNDVPTVQIETTTADVLLS